MAKPELVATRGFKYMTRRLLPGDEFEAKNSVEAMILTKVRKVAAVPLPKPVRKAPAKVEPAEDLTDLRAKYEVALGKRPYHGWDAATLREKIAEA